MEKSNTLNDFHLIRTLAWRSKRIKVAVLTADEHYLGPGPFSPVLIDRVKGRILSGTGAGHSYFKYSLASNEFLMRKESFSCSQSYWFIRHRIAIHQQIDLADSLKVVVARCSCMHGLNLKVSIIQKQRKLVYFLVWLERYSLLLIFHAGFGWMRGESSINRIIQGL